MRTNRFRYAPIVAAVLAAACGGDDGGGSTPPTPAAGTLVQITMTNQDAVARASIASVLPFTSFSLVGIAPASATPSTRASTASLPARSVLSHALARPLAVQSSAMPCEVSGTVTILWDDKDGSATLNPGDSLTMTFVQCSDSTDVTINGAMILSVSSAAAANFGGGMTLQQLTLTGEGASVLMNGALSFSVTETPASDGVRHLATYIVANTGLTVARSGSGYSDAFSYQALYSVTQEDFVPSAAGMYGTSTILANGNFKSSLLGGDLSLKTTEPFRLTDPDENPRAGQMMVDGFNETRLGLTALSNTQVRMDVCDDGDGVWEATKTVDWSSLMQ